jgi:hypothetical protein
LQYKQNNQYNQSWKEYLKNTAYLVGGFNPSETYKSVGMMAFPTEWKNKNHFPNHQPDIGFYR